MFIGRTVTHTQFYKTQVINTFGYLVTNFDPQSVTENEPREEKIAR